MKVFYAIIGVLALIQGQGVLSFVVGGSAPTRYRANPKTVVHMGFFDAIKKGFENENLDSPPPSAGLKNVRTLVLSARLE